jgi:ubiquinone/menaquinone biosynthesis C-methylase UbiE
LDIATGIGEPAVTAAEVVGDSSTTTTNGDSHVLAIDISPQMLAIAKIYIFRMQRLSFW